MLPAAIMWKIQGSLCSPTEFRLQHIRVPYSNVRVGVKVRRLVEPLVRIKRLLTVLASAELLKVHLQKRKKNEHNGRKFQILAKNYETFVPSKSTNIHTYVLQIHRTFNKIQVTGTFLSESTDVFIITPSRQTFFFPETENCFEIEDVLQSESLEACKGKKAAFGWLGQP